MVERSLSMREVGGSIPPFSTLNILHFVDVSCPEGQSSITISTRCMLILQSLKPEHMRDM